MDQQGNNNGLTTGQKPSYSQKVIVKPVFSQVLNYRTVTFSMRIGHFGVYRTVRKIAIEFIFYDLIHGNRRSLTTNKQVYVGP